MDLQVSVAYLVGDATDPAVLGPKMIVQCLSDTGAHDAGFALALRDRYPGGAQAYRNELQVMKRLGKPKAVGGHVFFYSCYPPRVDLHIASILGQHGLGPNSLRLEWLVKGMKKLSALVKLDTTFHLPRIGCGLAGGKWEEVGPHVENILGQRHDVYIYDLPK